MQTQFKDKMLKQVSKKDWKNNTQFLMDENRAIKVKARQAQEKAEHLQKMYENLDD